MAESTAPIRIRRADCVELDPEWSSEIRNRIAQIENGEAKTIPWDEVDARIRKSPTQK